MGNGRNRSLGGDCGARANRESATRGNRVDVPVRAAGDRSVREELGKVNGGAGSGTARWLADAAQMLQPLGATLAVVAMWLAPGKRAGLAAMGWMLVCGLMSTGGAVELGSLLTSARSPLARAGESAGPTRLGNITACVAQLDLAVGGAWLVASRLGLRPMGIQEPIGLLTAVHFHFAGFATALIASATVQFAEKRGELRWLRRVVMLVISLPFVVAAGFVISPALKMAAGLAFSASVAGLAAFVWMCANRISDGTARGMLCASAGAVFVGMALSGTYAVADFLGSDALTIPRMASTHGILNAMGFCLLGLLGWLIAGTRET